MSSPPHIVLLSKGLARYRYELTEHLGTALGDRAVLTAAPLGDDLWEVDFPALRSMSGRVRYMDFPTSWAELDALNPQLLGIMEYPRPMLRALLWATLRRVPVVVFSEVGRGEPDQETAWRTALLHPVMAHLTCGQVALAPAARLPFGASKRPILFAPHSVDTTQFTAREWPSSPPECTTLLTVAQYTPRKGLDLMAAALAVLKTKHRFTWRIIGVLSPDWLRSVIKEHQLTEQTVIVGVKQGQALIDEYRAADVFVLPSRFDTYGAVTQEAAASGLPLLISKFAGSSQTLVEEEVNGYVIDPNDQPAFVQRLDQMLSHPEQWPIMGRESRRVAERYCLRVIGAEMAEWLLTLIPGGSHAA
jgi:glycosyltransferase involved in cell wall biosynthesis